jgi:Fur family transcriptional regulator, ferric uptake regulator
MENKKRNPISKEWENRLSREGYRITTPRRTILDIIAESPRPLTPLQIYDKARESHPSIGLVTIYRTIEKLEELNLIEHIHHLGECQTVFRSSSEHQHLLICTNCGSSCYFDGLDVEETFKEIGRQHGYEITGHWLQLAGLCEECQQELQTIK